MDDQIEEMLNNKYLDIFEIQETLKQINTLEFEKFSINDKYELYNKIIDLYKYFYKDINEISKYEPRGPRTGGASGDSTPRRNDDYDIGYYYIILDIINNIKIILKKSQNIQIEQVVIELMKPERVLNRLMTYEDYEYT